MVLPNDRKERRKRMFKIYNIRLGFATNSSSSHSMIIIPGADKLFEDSYDALDGQYSRNNFTLVSEKAKRLYLAGQVFTQLERMIGEKAAAAVTYAHIGAHWQGEYIYETFEEWMYIDHQSEWYFPQSWNSKNIDTDFLEAVKEFFLQKDLIILGGSDEDEGHPLLTEAKTKEMGPFTVPFWGGTESVIRQDPKHKFWTLFDREDGMKVRFDFIDLSTMDFGKHVWNKKQEEDLVCSVPELIDIRLSSLCDKNCPFCYQDARPDGVHADTDYIKHVLDLLAQYRVFEVAFGGGETTLHPGLPKILEYSRSLGIVPNFSTKSLDWLKDDDYRTSVMESIGAFGYSVQSVKEVALFGHLMGDYRLSKKQAVVHYVMGSTTIETFEAIIREVAERDMSVILLGYKTVGRGKDFKPYNYGNWLDVIEKVRDDQYFEFSIDTLLAAESKKGLEEKDVPRWLYSVKDGGHSFYIDCVQRCAGPSSYSEDTVQCVSLKDLELIVTNIDEWKEIRERFLLREKGLKQWGAETEEGIFEEER